MLKRPKSGFFAEALKCRSGLSTIKVHKPNLLHFYSAPK
ncbi:hypothetical protein MCETRH20_01553 [Methylophilaceae bacterium]